MNRSDRYWMQQRRKELARGLHAELQGNKLVITKHGQPFKDFTIGATMDWMSGSFSIRGELFYQWDAGRRKVRRKFDCWETHAAIIVKLINQFSGETHGPDSASGVVEGRST